MVLCNSTDLNGWAGVYLLQLIKYFNLNCPSNINYKFLKNYLPYQVSMVLRQENKNKAAIKCVIAQK